MPGLDGLQQWAAHATAGVALAVCRAAEREHTDEALLLR
jgi:hypothetical protein